MMSGRGKGIKRKRKGTKLQDSKALTGEGQRQTSNPVVATPSTEEGESVLVSNQAGILSEDQSGGLTDPQQGAQGLPDNHLSVLPAAITPGNNVSPIDSVNQDIGLHVNLATR